MADILLLETPSPERVGGLSQYGLLRRVLGCIRGTVKIKTEPSNTPAHRRVRLVRQGSGAVVRETWSDPVTGEYEFRGIDEFYTYTVLSYDHTGVFRAVVADGQIPELMP